MEYAGSTKSGSLEKKAFFCICSHSAQFSSITQSCPTLLQHSRLPCPSPELTQTHVYWVSDAIQPSHPLSSLSPAFKSFPISGSFPMSQFFASGGQSIGASASVLPMSVQDWSPLGLTGWISLQSKGLSRVFSNNTVQKHQFFGVQPSLWSNSHIHTWLLEKPQHWLWFFSFKWYIFKMTLLPGSSFPNCYVGLYIYLKDNYHCPPHSFGRSQWW